MLTNYFKKKFMKTIYTKVIDPAHTMSGHVTIFEDTGSVYLYLENQQRVHVNRFINPMVTTRLYPFDLPTVLIDLLIRFSELPEEDYMKFSFGAYRTTMEEEITKMLNGVDTNVPEQFRAKVRDTLVKSIRIWGDWDNEDANITDSLCYGGMKRLAKIKEGSHTRYILASTYHGVLTLTGITTVNIKTGSRIVDMQRIDLTKEFIKGILVDGLNIIAVDEPNTQERSDV